MLVEVCKNPKNPGFNHYLFESVVSPAPSTPKPVPFCPPLSCPYSVLSYPVLLTCPFLSCPAHLSFLILSCSPAHTHLPSFTCALKGLESLELLGSCCCVL